MGDKKIEIVELSKIRSLPEDVEPLENFVGKEIVIANFEIVDTPLGERFLIYTNDGKKIYGFSTVVIDVLRSISTYINEGKYVKAKVVRKRSGSGRFYYVLE